MFSGLNMDTGELLAIKQVLIPEFKTFKDLERIREIEDEIAVLSKLAHPNIVRYIGTERNEDTLNIFLEYAGGGSISSLVQKYGRFPEKVVQVCCVWYNHLCRVVQWSEPMFTCQLHNIHRL